MSGDGLVEEYFFSRKIPNIMGHFYVHQTPNVMGPFYVLTLMGLFNVHILLNFKGLFYVQSPFYMELFYVLYIKKTHNNNQPANVF